MDWLWGLGKGRDDVAAGASTTAVGSAGGTAGAGGGQGSATGDGSSTVPTIGRRYVVDLCSRYLEALSSLQHATAAALLKDKRVACPASQISII